MKTETTIFIQRARRAFAYGDQAAFTTSLEQAIASVPKQTTLQQLLEDALEAYPSVDSLRLLTEADKHIEQNRP
ncbi:MAG: hypothetical protein JWN98_2021 [Abditibacteriota bacterium]|jgi:hypothetical protein|nr:hypothetical protein [Abditibacteriota bacterium]